MFNTGYKAPGTLGASVGSQSADAMSLSIILPMSAFALVASVSPGPVNLVCLSSGTRYPVSQGLVFVTGATLGFIALFMAVGLGLNSLLEHAPGFERWLSWAGAASIRRPASWTFRPVNRSLCRWDARNSARWPPDTRERHPDDYIAENKR